MKVKFFVIPLPDFEYAEQELNAFLSTNRILKVSRELVSTESNCFWTVAVDYLDAGPASTGTGALTGKPKVDYREVLSSDEFTLYSTLRDVRKELADREGIKVYNIFSNAQLAEMVQKNVISRSQMSSINGVGEAKLEKYADSFLAELQK